MLNDYWGGYLREAVNEPDENEEISNYTTFGSTGYVLKGNTLKIPLFTPRSKAKQEISIQIFDSIGNLIQEESTELKEGGDEIMLKLDNLTSGLYFVKMFTSYGHAYYEKFIYFK